MTQTPSASQKSPAYFWADEPAPQKQAAPSCISVCLNSQSESLPEDQMNNHPRRVAKGPQNGSCGFLGAFLHKGVSHGLSKPVQHGGRIHAPIPRALRLGPPPGYLGHGGAWVHWSTGLRRLIAVRSTTGSNVVPHPRVTTKVMAARGASAVPGDAVGSAVCASSACRWQSAARAVAVAHGGVERRGAAGGGA